MRVVTAVENDFGKDNEIRLFLAGGITNCPDWQKAVIERLSEIRELDDLVVFNPRRENFPIHDPNASDEQIKWEFDRLQIMDLFSMFFTSGESDQPICMYELGRNLMTMHVKFPEDWENRVVVTYDSNYRRAKDVEVQTKLAFSGNTPKYMFSSDDYDTLIEQHVQNIISAYRELKRT